MLHTWSGWREYEHIWLPDDDILTSQRVINDMFDVASGVGLDLYTPALDEHSYYAHFDMLQNRSFFGRWVGFVEIMVPGFSRTALEALLPTLDLSETGWGLGLDSVWPKLLDYKNVGVIDGLPVTHTRPIGQRRDDELARRMLDESDVILERYECRQVHATFGAFGADLRPLDLAPEALLAELVCGWQYVFERDPRVLAWIVDYQGQFFTWPDYPVEGTPDPRAAGGRLHRRGALTRPTAEQLGHVAPRWHDAHDPGVPQCDRPLGSFVTRHELQHPDGRKPCCHRRPHAGDGVLDRQPPVSEHVELLRGEAIDGRVGFAHGRRQRILRTEADAGRNRSASAVAARTRVEASGRARGHHGQANLTRQLVERVTDGGVGPQHGGERLGHHGPLGDDPPLERLGLEHDLRLRRQR